MKKPIKTKWIILALIFLFPVGLILLWLQPSWNKRTKWIVTGILAVTLFFGAIFNAIDAKTSTETVSNNSQASTSQVTPTPAVTQQMKDDYISFYKQYMTIANQSDAANKKVMADVTAASSGTSDKTTADLYLEASDAEDTQNSLKNQIVSIQVPSSLSDYNDDLNNADTQLFSLISDRSDTMKNMADYLNTNDLSKLKAIQNSTQNQQSEMEQAVVNLVTVAQKLGVDTSKIKVGQ
jgi:hypothetical protein